MSNQHLNPVMDEILDRHFNRDIHAQAKAYMPSTCDRADPSEANRHFIAKALAETERVAGESSARVEANRKLTEPK